MSGNVRISESGAALPVVPHMESRSLDHGHAKPRSTCATRCLSSHVAWFVASPIYSEEPRTDIAGPHV